MYKKMNITILLGINILMFSACSSNKRIAEIDFESQVQEKVQRFENYGSQIQLSKMPEKVITMGPSASELFVALGISDKIIGNTLDNHSRGALPEYKEAYDQIPELNYSSATREAVLSSSADFIYGVDWDFGPEGLDKQELMDYGITVYQSLAKTIEEQAQEIRDIGLIFEVEEKAQKLIDNQEKRIANISEKIKGKEEKRVLVYDSGEKGIFTSSGINFESLLIQQAGGKNIFFDLTDKEWVTVSEEEVLARNPEVIVVHDYDTPPVAEKIAVIKKDPILAQTDAVKNDRIFAIPLESVLPGPRIALTIEIFYKNFHDSFE